MYVLTLKGEENNVAYINKNNNQVSDCNIKLYL